MRKNKVKCICISGSRDGFTYKEFKDYMDENFSDIYALISGGARGVDYFAEEYALEKGIRFIEKKADWDNHGKSAGRIRNENMAKFLLKKKNRGYDAFVVAFCYDNSKGTTHMIDYSKSIGLRVIEIHKNSVDSFDFDS